MKQSCLSILLATASLLLSGCFNNVEDVTGEVQSNVSFADDIQPIFNARCVSCHGDSLTNGGLNLTSYQSATSGSGARYGDDFIVPGNASESGLVDSIEPNPDSGVSRMPQGGPFLSGTQIELIKAWINEGALNN